MRPGRLGLPASICALACALAATAAPAHAADAPGPAWVDGLASQLLPLRDADRSDIALARDSDLTIRGGSVVVDVAVIGDLEAAAERLEAAGMEVVAAGEKPRPTVEGYLPLDAIDDVGRLGVTDAVIPVVGGGTDAGSVTSLGVTRHNIPAAIAAGGTSGGGIDVGVISDSFDRVGTGLAGSQASGDLPANTVVVKEGPPAPVGSDEGRAMAEIIYDEAPGVDKIMFANGVLGPFDKADSINRLVAAGADVIADDTFYLGEPFFQDGVIAKAVNAARAQDVAYFASAGNRARQSYESTYSDDGGGLHDFDPTAVVNTRNCFSGTVPSGAFLQVALGWDEPVGGVSTDIDLRLVTPAGATLAESASDSIAIGSPKEFAAYTNPGPGDQQVCVEIRRDSGAGTPLLKWIEFDNFPGIPVPAIDTQSDTINPDAGSAQGALTVAAVNQADPGLDTPESFSSRGPKTRLFDGDGVRLATPLVLPKPELAAADQVNTTVPGFAPFGGTSAAAPSAAGIATILRSLNPNATVNEIYATMTNPANAIDCTSSAVVPDPDCGAGFILADRAVADLDRTGAVVSAVTSPGKPNGKGGWFTKRSVGVAWTVADPESPIESSVGCDPVRLKAEGKRKLTCTATSGGGPTSLKVTVKHDTKPPSKPKLKGLSRNGPLPPKRKLRCVAKDKTSGIASCRVGGYSTSPGRHKLKLTATDKAGLRSKATVVYTVG